MWQLVAASRRNGIIMACNGEMASAMAVAASYRSGVEAYGVNWQKAKMTTRIRDNTCDARRENRK